MAAEHRWSTRRSPEFIAENVPLFVVAALIVVGIYHYLTREFERQLVEIVRPRIKLGNIKEHIEFPDGGTLDQQHLEVQNIGKGILARMPCHDRQGDLG